MPPVGALTSDATSEPLTQEAKEARTGGLLPLDPATGAKATLVDGVAQPDLGSPEAPWGTLHGQRVVVAGVEVNLQDIANFAPLLITRAGDAPATGQHAQTFAWPFVNLTRAFVVIFGPQSGGQGGYAGFFVTPPLGTPISTPFGTGGSTGLGTGLGVADEHVLTAEDVRKFGQPGGDGYCAFRTLALEGLSLASEVSLSFGLGGAGGVGEIGFPRGDENFDDDTGTFFYYGPTRPTEPTMGAASTGFTHISAGGAGGLVGGTQNNPETGRRKLTNTSRPSDSHIVPYLGGLAEARSRTVFTGGRQQVAGVLCGAGGAPGLPLSYITSTTQIGNPGNPGGAGHNGYVLIFPRP